MIEWHRVHVVGVAGVGMSAVAQAALGVGLTVSGSDRYYDSGSAIPILGQLIQAGVTLCPQDGSGVREGVDAVIVSTAIEADNPDIQAAARLGVPVVHRSELLAKLIAGHTCLAVAGTCGKSTVTGMVGWILQQAGMNPTVVNGAPVVNWQSESVVGNVRMGGDLWVIEADESDRSLLNFHPDHAVITNMSADHFDLQETRRVFAAFRERVKGACIGALDVESYLGGVVPQVSAGESRFAFRGVAFNLMLPGAHNVENALHAVMLCERVGVSVSQSAAALSRFRGIHRRLEVASRVNGVTVVDDYAHNPAKIRAALAAVQPFADRMVVIWRPHGYGPLRSMLDGLTDTFSVLRGDQYKLLLLPVYDVGGTADRCMTSDTLAKRLAEQGVDVACVDDYVAVRQAISESSLKAGDAVMVMGARDPDLPLLARTCLGT